MINVTVLKMSETTLQYICDKVSCVYKDDRRGLIEKEIIEWIVAIGGALLIVGIVLKFIGTSYSIRFIDVSNFPR